MSGLKELRNRVKTTAAIGKITKAMKLVSASKLRKAAANLDSSHIYFAHVMNLLGVVISNSDEKNPMVFPNMIDNKKRYAIILYSSDRGLCSSFNTTMLKLTFKRIAELQAHGHNVTIFTIGKKAALGQYKNLSRTNFLHSNSLHQELASYIMSHAGEFDVWEFVHTNYKSALSQVPKISQIIPLDNMAQGYEPYNGEIIFEPKISELLDIIIPKILSAIFKHLILETYVSEQAARMNAMDNASKNAKEMMEKLTLVLNRSRQALITKELIEIVSGAESI